MKSITLAYDWIGPQGPWPNSQCLGLLVDPSRYEPSSYAPGNAPNPYNLETRRHQFTYPKIDVLLAKFDIKRKHISQLGDQPAVYELTPLLKPYQWADDVFDNVSELACQMQRTGQLLFFINDMNEGYSVTGYNFYHALHTAIIKRGLRADGVIYISANALQQQQYQDYVAKYNITAPIRTNEVFLFELLESSAPPIAKEYHYICLNRSPAPHRQALAYELWRRGLSKYGLISMPGPDSVLDLQLTKSYVEHYGFDASKWDEFIACLPFVIDTAQFDVQDCSANSLSKFYHKSLISIVTENTYTDEDSDCVKFTEKTFRPIANHCVPAFVYSDNASAVLHDLGYMPASNPSSLPKFLDWLELFVKQPVEYYTQSFASVSDHNYNLLSRRSNTAKDSIMGELLDGHTT